MSHWTRRFKRDHFGGALVIVIGTAYAAQASRYELGSLTQMGAGFMPAVYGSLLAIVGIIMMLTSARSPEMPRHTEWRGWGCILGAIAAFVMLGHFGGFGPAAFAAVFVSALGDRKNRLRDAALLAAGVTLFGYLVFIRALQMPFPFFAWNF